MPAPTQLAPASGDTGARRRSGQTCQLDCQPGRGWPLATSGQQRAAPGGLGQHTRSSKLGTASWPQFSLLAPAAARNCRGGAGRGGGAGSRSPRSERCRASLARQEPAAGKRLRKKVISIMLAFSSGSPTCSRVFQEKRYFQSCSVCSHLLFSRTVSAVVSLQALFSFQKGIKHFSEDYSPFDLFASVIGCFPLI